MKLLQHCFQEIYDEVPEDEQPGCSQVVSESPGGVEVYEPWENDGPAQETYEIADPNGPQDFYEVPDSEEPETYEVPEPEQPEQETYEVPDPEPGKHSGLLRCIVVYKGITARPRCSPSTNGL